MCHSARSHSSTDTAKPQLPRANFASSLPEFSAGSMKMRHFQPSRTLQAFHSTHTGQPACSSTPPRTLPPRNLCRREAIKEAPQFFPSSDLVPPARQPLLQSAVAQRRHACQGKSLDTGRIIKPVSLSTSQKDQKKKSGEFCDPSDEPDRWRQGLGNSTSAVGVQGAPAQRVWLRIDVH
jgi:hypothetical protein